MPRLKTRFWPKFWTPQFSKKSKNPRNKSAEASRHASGGRAKGPTDKENPGPAPLPGKIGGFVDRFLHQNGSKMDPKREPKLRKNEMWARWAANGRPMGSQSLQNDAQWNPQAPKMDPRTHKMELWRRQNSHKMDPKTIKMKHRRTPKLQNQRKQRWPS